MSKHIDKLEELTPRLVDSFSMMTNLFKYSKDLITITNDAGNFVMLADHWSEVLGYRKELILNTPWCNLVHPDDLLESTQNYEIMKNNPEELVDFNNRYRKYDGSYVALNWNSSAFIDGYCYAVARVIGKL